MDYDQLVKFRPVLKSPLWERLEDDILLPELELARIELETVDDATRNNMARGKIKFIKELLKLKDYAKQMEKPDASGN